MNIMLMKILAILWLALAAPCLRPSNGFAQNYPYRVNFEPAATRPANKPYANSNPVTIDNIDWTMPGVYLGNPVTNTPGDFFNGTRSARMRLTSNTTGDPGHITMLGDLPNGIEDISFQTAMYGTGTGGKLLLCYSTNGGNTWLPLGDTIMVPPKATPLTVTRTLHIAGNVRISIQKAERSNNRINIDDLLITEYGVPIYLRLLHKSPEGDQIPISLKELHLQFNAAITPGTGSLILQQLQGPAQICPIPSANVSVQDSTAIISGFTLAHKATYYALLDSGAFLNTAMDLAAMAITDTTAWTFSTEDTSTISPRITLNETFAGCRDNDLGSFRQYSFQGNKVWNCTTEGHEDNAAVFMYGGYVDGVSESNKDWLISVAPFDFSAMTTPVLHFWQKKRHAGNVERAVLISYDYTGAGMPEDAGWIPLDIPGFDIEAPDEWTFVKDIDLESHKDTPFYLAFTYACPNNGAYELSYDDIGVTEGIVGLNKVRPQQRSDLKVLGQPSSSILRLGISLEEAAVITLRIFNLTGHLIYQQEQHFQAGSHLLQLQDLALAAGVYIIRMHHPAGYKAVKAVVY